MKTLVERRARKKLMDKLRRSTPEYRAQGRAWYKQRRIDNPKKEKDKWDKYYSLNQERLIKKSQAYRDAHPGHAAKYSKERYYKNRERCNQQSRLYKQTVNGRNAVRKSVARRARDLDFFPLNKWFAGSVGHHINKLFVVYVPEKLHCSVHHNLSHQESMDKINTLVCEFLLSDAVLSAPVSVEYIEQNLGSAK